MQVRKCLPACERAHFWNVNLDVSSQDMSLQKRKKKKGSFQIPFWNKNKNVAFLGRHGRYKLRRILNHGELETSTEAHQHSGDDGSECGSTTLSDGEKR